MSVTLWKFQRELRRAGSQLLEPYRQIRDALLRLDYRVRHAHHVKHFEGDAAWTARVAVFLIYQPHGVADSVLATCRYLRQQGYACVLVVNGPLGQQARQRVSAEVAHIIARPNFGYDFGGYQEAVLWLRQSSAQIDQLLMLNDSVWFPSLRNSNFLADMEKADADVVGALSAERGRLQRHQRKLFYASFLLLFSGKVWRSTEFANFWIKYRQTSSKARTIRKGERKLSALFIHDDRFTHHAMVHRQTYQDLVMHLDALSWPLLAQELVVMDTSLDQERTTLLGCLDGDVVAQWREWYERLCDSQNMFACAQASLVIRSALPFIKKSKDPHNMLVLERSLSVFQDFDDMDPLVFQEIKTHVNSHLRRHEDVRR